MGDLPTLGTRLTMSDGLDSSGCVKFAKPD
jgi:hypothetical protein